MYTTKMNQRGQVTIPKELREKYNLQPGSEVIIEEVEGKLLIEKGVVVPEWFAKMGPEVEEALQDIRKKRYQEYDSMDDFIADLNA